MTRHFVVAVLWVGLSAGLLAACEANMADHDYHTNHPIKVETRTALLILEPGPGGRIKPVDTPAIGEFAGDFVKKAAGGLTVRVGANSASDALASSFAGEVTQALVSRGISVNSIQLSYLTDPESAKYGRAVMEFPIYVALVDECGTWKDRPEFTPLNENTYNYGCSMQRNLAAMIVNPHDLTDATPSTGRLAARADAVVGKYIIGGKIGASSESPAIAPMTTTGGL